MRKYYFSTKDLVTIALLSALGGVLSTYIGYLGNMMNHVVGVPFGAGQFMAGLHVIWIMLALGITRKKGAATVTGLLKGVIELFLGSTHGIVIVVVSLVQGLIPDIILFNDKAKANRGPVFYALAGGVAAASNVVVFQMFFFSGIPLYLVAMLCMLAAASGIIFGGWLVLEMLESLELSGMILGKRRLVVDDPDVDEALWVKGKADRRKALAAVVVAVVFLSTFTVGAVYYFVFVFDTTEGSIEVVGAVADPYEFRYEDFSDVEVTVYAELIGSVTHVDPRDYTGVPLHDILSEADPDDGATQVVVSGRDGYYVVFQLGDVMEDDELIVIQEGELFRVVAANYEGAFWVEDVISVEVI